MSEPRGKDLCRLNESERDSKAWEKVKRYANDRIERFRKVTEDPFKPDLERVVAATRINELKDLLKLGEPASQPQPEPGD